MRDQPGLRSVAKGDRVQVVGLRSVVVAPILAVVGEMAQWVPDVPRFASIPESLTLTQQVLEGLNAVARLTLTNPWLAGTVALGALLSWLGPSIKAVRPQGPGWRPSFNGLWRCLARTHGW